MFSNVADIVKDKKSDVSRRLTAALMIPALCLVSGCRWSRRAKIIEGIPQVAQQEIFLTERAGAEQAAASAGVSVTWEGSSDSDPQRQVDLLSAASAEGRYGIILSPVGRNTVDSVILSALAKSIPVVVTRDSIALPLQPHLSFVLEDYAAGADIVVRRLKEIVGENGSIAILGVDPQSDSSTSRLDALENTLRQTAPGLQVIEHVVSPYSIGSGQLATERMIRRHRKIDAFVALNNRAGLGAAIAIAEERQSTQAKLIVFDQSLPLMLRLRRGEIDSVVVQQMRTMGEIAVQNIEADHKGEAYQRVVHLRPLLVSLQTINATQVQEALRLNWDPQ